MFFQSRIVREENVCLFFNVPKGPPIDFFFQFYKSFLFVLIYTKKCWYFKVTSSDFITILQQQNFEIISQNNKKAKKKLRPNFAFHQVFTSFHLEFLSFWISRSFDLGDLGVLRMGPVNVFKNYIFEISAFKGKR